MIKHSSILLCMIITFLGTQCSALERGNVYAPLLAWESLPIVNYSIYAIKSTKGNTVASAYLQGTNKSTFYKGLVGENIMHNILKSTGWTYTESRLGVGGPQGLDGLYVKYNKNGVPKNIMVSEAKYGSSQLGNTNDGKQMSYEWITKRLKQAARRYSTAAKDIEEGKIVKSDSFPDKRNTSIATIRLKNRMEVTLYKDKNTGKWIVYPSNGYTEKELSESLKAHSDIFEKAANGKIPYKRRIFRVDVVNNKISLKISKYNEVTDTYSTEEYIDKIPAKYSKYVDELIIKLMREQTGCSEQEASDTLIGLTRQQKLEKLTTMLKITPDIITEGLFSLSVQTGLCAAIIESASQILLNDSVSYSRIAKMAGIGFVSAYSGLAAGRISTLLMARAMHSNTLNFAKSGLASHLTSLPDLSAGIVTSAAFSYGSYFAGLTDLQTANKAFLSGAATSFVVTYAVPKILMTIAMTYGTASTGTAISTLSGAAATNAALAWLGGGSMATGGVLIGVVGGAVIFAPIFIVGVKYGMYKWREYNDSVYELRKINNMLNSL